MADPTSAGSENYEVAHVHEVYQQIAPHFSATRFKPWPIVERFLQEMPTGSVGLDVGCGNGKYLTVNPGVYMIGSDRSPNLVHIAHERKSQESFIADALDLPHPGARFDFVISIAVIHHFSSRERRVAAIKSILAVLKRAATQNALGGRALIYVWALEQKNSRRGWDEGHAQDVLVPWVLSKQYSRPSENSKKGLEAHCQAPKDVPELQTLVNDTPQEGNTEAPKETIYQRYYHLYRQGELEADVVVAGGSLLESGYEKDNWWAICSPLE